MSKDRDEKSQKKPQIAYDHALDQRRFSIGDSAVRRAAPTNHILQALAPQTSDKKTEKPKDKK